MVYATNNRLSEGSRHVDEFTQLPPTTIPDVTTEAPETTATAATLKGKVSQDLPNAGSKIVYCKFEWGPGTGNTFPEQEECEPPAPLEGENIAVQATIEGLTKGATYHYRLAAKSENEIQSNGANIQFKASGPPTISEDVVSDVNTDSVRLSAEIDPNGGDTEYHFEFGENHGIRHQPADPGGSGAVRLAADGKRCRARAVARHRVPLPRRRAQHGRHNLGQRPQVR